MSKKKNDGGPAFPVTGYAASNGHTPPVDVWSSGFGGMTLRDYFAGQAMNGMLDGDGIVLGYENKFAIACYRMADAMIEARDK